MKPVLSFFLFLFFSISCSENSKENVIKNFQNQVEEPIEKIVEEKVDSIQLEINEIAKRIITNRNVVKKLTEFADSVKLNRISMYTKYGKMKFKLYSNTPLHRANFVLLANNKIFDNNLFYRVIDNFMIQGGNSENESISMKLNRIGNYRIPNEIKTNNIHKKGALVMAVPTEEQDFGKKSSQINFYIVEGRKMQQNYFEQKKKIGKKFSSKQISVYTTQGGAPHLDGDYTVFGEMISGFNVLSRISKTKVDSQKWPLKDVVIDSIRAY